MVKELKLVIDEKNIRVYEDDKFRGNFSPKGAVKFIRKMLDVETFDDVYEKIE